MRYAFLVFGMLIFSAPGLVRGEEPSIPGVAASTTSMVDFNELDLPVQMLEQEFDPALLNDLVQLSTVPAQVRLPALVIKADEWQGSQCGIGKSAHAVFRRTADWEKFWTLAIKPYLSKPLEAPKVDFSKDMVVAVFRGEGAHPGDLIQIQSIKTETGGVDPVLVVSYRNSSKMQPVFIPPFVVQPFHMKKVASFPGRVSFRQIKR